MGILLAIATYLYYEQLRFRTKRCVLGPENVLGGARFAAGRLVGSLLWP